MEEWSVEDYRKIDGLSKETKEWLLQLDSNKRLNVVREILKNPHYDESDVYILCLNEYQIKSDHKPPEPRNPFKIRFRMREQKPIKPITEEKNTVKKSEKRMGRKRPRGEDWSGGEEETGREKKKRVDKKKKKKKKKKKMMVNPVVLSETQRDLPAELKDRIRALNGSDVIMVIEKELYKTDLNTGNGRLSLPARQIDMRFLTEEEKVFLATKQDGSKVTRIRSRIIGEGGMEQGICLCKWSMPKSLSENVSVIYNLLSGWNDVLKAHELRNDKLCTHTTVQLWSFRVEGNLWFAFVEVSKSPDCNCKRYA